MFCTSCGVKNIENAKFCTSCGKPISILNEEKSTNTVNINNDVNKIFSDDYEHKMLEAFIGKPEKVAYYSDAFKKFESDGYQKYWSWWGFFGTIFFLIHRKIYIYVIVIILLSFILSYINPYVKHMVDILIMLALGMFSPYLIYNRYKKLKSEVENKTTNTQSRIEFMIQKGGVVPLWKVILSFILFIAIFIGFDIYSNPQNYGIPLKTVETSQGHGPIKINYLEVYYTDTVTNNEAVKLANYLAKVNYGTETGATVQLNKEDGVYQCRMVILPSFIDDPENIKNMQIATLELSNDVFNGSPVDIHFCDDQMITKRIISFQNNN